MDTQAGENNIFSFKKLEVRFVDDNQIDDYYDCELKKDYGELVKGDKFRLVTVTKRAIQFCPYGDWWYIGTSKVVDGPGAPQLKHCFML